MIFFLPFADDRVLKLSEAADLLREDKTPIVACTRGSVPTNPFDMKISVTEKNSTGQKVYAVQDTRFGPMAQAVFATPELALGFACGYVWKEEYKIPPLEE